MSSIVRFYVNFLAKGLNLYQSMGKGYFRAHSEADISEDTLVDEAMENGDEDAGEFEGWIYAFSFPSITHPSDPFPIKVGKTVGKVEDRVAEQVRGSASFEQPIILGRWRVKRVGPTELAIHNILKARNKWRDTAPGREWFNASLTEIESIVAFVKSE
ncbi:GIY-YIG nuclease family protein [Limnohabitans sp.]|uniref:GIY-YIG nuclease family protein n=1 Tax=Limnohabitans sp. TaxID=1907725 RepID=UPI00286F57FF|nr:GIY-YIG nuclease family protein [Limnohabitans sp.]